MIFYFNYYPSFYRANVGVHSSYQQAIEEIQNLEQKKSQYTLDNQLRLEILREEPNIKQCLNNEDLSVCFSLPEWMTKYQAMQQQLSGLNAKFQE